MASTVASAAVPAGVAPLLRAAAADLQRRDPAAALRAAQQAEALAPRVPDVHICKGAALRMAGDPAGGLRALDAALAIDPQNLIALLSKASLLEDAVGARPAARVFRAALALVADDARVPPPLLPAVRHARQAVQADTAALHEHLRARTGLVRARFAGAALDRFDESLDVFAGVARPVRQQPQYLHYSGMPAIAFHDRAAFAWLPELEAATGAITEELHGLLEGMREGFTPYIKRPPGTPVAQWGELNHSPRWSSAFLWEDGVRHDEACRRCPRTTALMDRLPLMRHAGFAPTVSFSALEPHTHIPPHTGSSAVRLLVHLPLILPGPARFRVGNETRAWRMGEAWVFDDTIEHEAWNDADGLRVILIADIWNPLLSEAERELVMAMMDARKAYYAGADAAAGAGT